MFLAAGPTAAWTRPVTVLLQGATLIAALSASGVRPRLVRVALFVVLAGFAGALVNALLVAVAPIAIASSVVRRRVIDVQTVLAALCIYVLLGMLWAFVFTAIG